MSQKHRILSWLKRGRSITQAKAYELFGCLRLSERIREIEQDGYAVNHERHGKKFMTYRMA